MSIVGRRLFAARIFPPRLFWGGVTPVNSGMVLMRGGGVDNGKGNKQVTFFPLQGGLPGTVRFYRPMSTRQHLESSPGVQTLTGLLVFFDEPYVELDVHVNDRLLLDDGRTLKVLHPRRYETSLQLDTEIVQ